jgi:CARDB
MEHGTMQPHRTFLVALLSLGLAVTAARAEPPSRALPGGPILLKAPELYVESIDVTWSNSSPCVGASAAQFTVSVTIKNGWIGNAYMPGTWPPAWVLVWSPLGGVSAPYAAYLGYPLKLLAPGQSHTFTTKLTLVGKYFAAKSQTVFTVEVLVDPSNAIAEINENNNDTYKDLIFGGQACK